MLYKIARSMMEFFPSPRDSKGPRKSQAGNEDMTARTKIATAPPGKICTIGPPNNNLVGLWYRSGIGDRMGKLDCCIAVPVSEGVEVLYCKWLNVAAICFSAGRNTAVAACPGRSSFDEQSLVGLILNWMS